MIRLESVCRRPFNEAVFEACSAITTCGGWIKDHRLYSNMMAMIAFEVPAGRLEALAAALADAGIVIETRPVAEPGSTADMAGQLTINFVNRGPDVRRVVPTI